MWRVIPAISLLLTLVLAGQADASPVCDRPSVPSICVASVGAEKTDSGTRLSFTLTSLDGTPLPETATAVVMQVDGNRSKCINVTLLRTELKGPFSRPDAGSFTASYAGTFTAFYGNSSINGRVDIGGSIFEFGVALDGTGWSTLKFVPATSEASAATATAAPTLRRDSVPEAAPASAADTARTSGSEGPMPQPVAWLGLAAIAITIVTALFERRRALARASTG